MTNASGLSGWYRSLVSPNTLASRHHKAGFGASAELSGGSDQWMLLRMSALAFFLLMLLAMSALRRADELGADAFAIEFSGEDHGAAQYFAFIDDARQYSDGHLIQESDSRNTKKYTRTVRALQVVLRLLSTHPSHQERLEFMRSQLVT
ncbi:M48 family metalloprotease [Arthrobacter caoxuetaonis]|uniref:M48 family metalloprotease n=1 Tax=Arthrobacter caoxuetaonis TaxID=2886935 RepID=A0A9X1MFK4_9MICC|nr:M48 family metalloprotease [Arthrobacter caoxuetaonis]MCC3298305.1 M48 family metalloprotease [Arthrobacter caoxuetaonis]USQ57678.1 M48 family metalloprotease [Arthrobacter caoxuetaonis]